LLQTINKGEESNAQIILHDLKELEKMGLIPDECRENVEKIRKMLGNKHVHLLI